MPALRLFGRKWLAASDDLVFPCLFELLLRIIWLVLMSLALVRYWDSTLGCDGGTPVRAYMAGTIAVLSAGAVLLLALINRSAQGTITDTRARRHVAPLLAVKIFLHLPELGLNILGTLWAFSDVIVCPNTELFSRTVIEAIVLFNWVLFALTVFGLAMVFDPLGSTSASCCVQGSPGSTATPSQSNMHRKLTALWLKRFRWACCCMRSDELGNEAFQQIAALLSTLFRGTDLVPSDVLAGCVLLRVRQKRDTRERRRLQMLAEEEPQYTTDMLRIFSTCPSWMNMHMAKHFMRFSMATYGWPFVMYTHCCTGLYRLMRKATCCACFRSKPNMVTDDNCCLCHLAGVRYMSRLRSEDILYASFRNHVFELPFCVLLDHKTRSVVVAVRGSISLRDVITDLVAGAESFTAQGLPPDSMAHRGMAMGAEYINGRLRDRKILDKAFQLYPEYGLVLTGHSLGAGVAVLLALKLRPRYPDVKVYAFSTPAGLLSREAAKCTENFVFTVGVGDDFVMRLGVDSIENLRTCVLETLRACKLPKYRIVLNGLGYAMFGVPSRDLETTWRDDVITRPGPGHSPLLGSRPISTVSTMANEAALIADVSVRRFCRTKLYTAGKILHIAYRKRTKLEKKSGGGGNEFELRWAQPEDFSELAVMPRMLLDHLPENVYLAISKVIRENPSLRGTKFSQISAETV
ncbi:sn1-specific diacylglycerol lipase beta-like [Ctenocephalides felis]|uniref:sn1-specific diacylglycerol lipase beta-like n=1 Tax=Ctenocephalides felis TaxID=7515 RepID=UPI000E6E39C1|nr:sn1-specific diacylglycerol lipase beta-like [Ctenocephalides felis]